MQYGLVGKTLGHSYSPFLHSMLGSVPYELFALDEEEFARFMEKREFSGVNVTIPYKQKALACCDELDETARAAGAVNTVVNRGGHLFGYNTDAAGLTRLLTSLLPSLTGKTALILGTGGTAHTARYVLGALGAGEVLTASRTPGPGQLSYAQAEARQDVQLVVNTTPAGMFPGNGECPLSLDGFPQLEAVADAVYNPAKTALVLAAEKRGVPAAGGLLMLAEQARVSSELFTGRPQPQEKTAELVAGLQKQLYNLVLIGMPGCGKSSLGRQLAKRTGRRFVDLDTAIAKTQGRTPGAIIEAEGEDAFRAIEMQAARETGKQNGLVIATGGGAVLREETVDALRQNGVLVWIDCPAELLSIGKHRPLSRSLEDLKRLEAVRRPLYEKAADGRIAYHPVFRENLALLLAKSDELLGRPLPPSGGAAASSTPL